MFYTEERKEWGREVMDREGGRRRMWIKANCVRKAGLDCY